MKPKQPVNKDALIGRTVFSTKEAAAYCGRNKATFIHHIYNQGLIPPLRVNDRLIVFSREQLDDYKLRGRTDISFEASLYTFTDAAAFLGLAEKDMRDLVDNQAVEPVDGVRIGGQFIYTEAELERVKNQGACTQTCEPVTSEGCLVEV